MAAFNAIKVGDILYDCRRTKMGNTTMRSLQTWRVVVKEVDAENRRVLASWNGNPPTWWSERKLRSLRRSMPATKKLISGQTVRA